MLSCFFEVQLGSLADQSGLVKRGANAASKVLRSVSQLLRFIELMQNEA